MYVLLSKGQEKGHILVSSSLGSVLQWSFVFQLRPLGYGIYSPFPHHHPPSCKYCTHCYLFISRVQVGLSIAPEFFLDTNEVIAQSLYLCVSLWQSGFFFVLHIINTNSQETKPQTSTVDPGNNIDLNCKGPLTDF